MSAIRFHHGLGDCANFAFSIPLYSARGHQIRVNCTPDKDPLFRAAGAVIDRDGPSTHHHWAHASAPGRPDFDTPWAGNKAAWNLSAKPLPEIGSYKELWPEYTQTRLDTFHLATPAAKARVNDLLRGIGDTPVVCLHTKGNTGPESKNLDDETTLGLYRELIDRTDAVLIVLDWDNRVPWFHSWRIRHVGGLSLPELFCLLQRSSLLIGIDSGVQHFARCAPVSVLGLWTHHYPSHYALPSPTSLHVVPEDFRETTKFRRWDWHVIESPGGKRLDAATIADAAARLLQGLKPREVLLDQLRSRCRGYHGALSDYVDRHRSFAVMADFLRTCRSPDGAVMVETGTIRAEEDWSGAGFSTYWFGGLLSELGGQLHSVDLDKTNVEFARRWTQQLPAVHCHHLRGEDWLVANAGPIDLLYLDSCDTEDPRHEDVCLSELRAGLDIDRPRKPRMVAIDDTVRQSDRFAGKGAKAVPYLIDRGWQVKYSGYQTVLTAD